MLDELIAEPFVLNLCGGNHEGLEAQFSQFANKVMQHCSEDGPVSEKYSALVTLETRLEIGAMEKPSIIQTIVTHVVNFLRKMRKALIEPWYTTRSSKGDDNHSRATIIENHIGLPHPEISVTEGTELVYFAKHSFFADWPISKVIDKVNAFLGMNLSYQQVYNNWPNVQRRAGEERALFVRRCLKRFEQAIIEASVITDKRSKKTK